MEMRRALLVATAPRRALWLALGLACLPGIGYAKSPDSRALSNSGIANFRRGDYQRAIRDFEASYALEPMAELRFNIAQALRLLGNCPGALHNYQDYLRAAPDGRLRPKALARIAELQSCATAEQAPAAADQPNATVAPGDPTSGSDSDTGEQTTEPPDSVPGAAHQLSVKLAPEPARIAATAVSPRRPVYKRWWLWTTVGAVALVGVGVGLAVGLTPANAQIPNTMGGNVSVSFR